MATGWARPGTNLQVLDGVEYCRYAIPVDYLPSRDFSPRWGYSRPPEPILWDWFTENIDNYQSFIDEMKRYAPDIADIPVEFDAANLPTPAWGGVPYAPFDGLALYSMIRKHAPRTYFEIGSGITTAFAYRAIKDAGLSTRIISIDPEPRAAIDSICDRVIRDALETCDVDVFQTLESGDILFLDGSHRSFMNSDVTVFMIDILPRLKPGVIVHVHDINIPWDYPASFRNWYWNEQYILAVYMMGNRARIDPLFPTTFVCRHEGLAHNFTSPFIDLGALNDGWCGGGAMWFTHTAPA